MQANYPPDIANTLGENAFIGWNNQAAVAAGTPIAETVIGELGHSGTGLPISSIEFSPAAAVALNASNFTTWTVAKRTAGGAAVTLGTFSTATTAMAQWTPAVFTLAAGAFLSPGDIVTVKTVESGTGASKPQGELSIFTSVN